MTEEKPKRWGWYSKKEYALMTDEERAKNKIPYVPPTETVNSLLKDLLENQSQILHELSEIRAQIMWLQDDA